MGAPHVRPFDPQLGPFRPGRHILLHVEQAYYTKIITEVSYTEELLVSKTLSGEVFPQNYVCRIEVSAIPDKISCISCPAIHISQDAIGRQVYDTYWFLDRMDVELRYPGGASMALPARMANEQSVVKMTLLRMILNDELTDAIGRR